MANETCDTCKMHEAFAEKISQVERQIAELKSLCQEGATRKELQEQRERLETEISELKRSGAALAASSNNLQQTLTRLEEMTKYLKEMINNNQKQTEQLIEKLDKMYVLIQTSIVEKAESRTVQAPSAPVQVPVVNNPSKTGLDITFLQGLLSFLKANAIAITALILFAIYLLTGEVLKLP